MFKTHFIATVLENVKCILAHSKNNLCLNLGNIRWIAKLYIAHIAVGSLTMFGHRAEWTYGIFKQKCTYLFIEAMQLTFIPLIFYRSFGKPSKSIWQSVRSVSCITTKNGLAILPKIKAVLSSDIKKCRVILMTISFYIIHVHQQVIHNLWINSHVSTGALFWDFFLQPQISLNTFQIFDFRLSNYGGIKEKS